MKVIIVDDEYEILEDIKSTILKYEDFKVVGTYTNPFEALGVIKETEPVYRTPENGH